MSCIIIYKGQKYSEEQFKEYFINNKQEFATSIAKNKDVIDSFKRKMERIDFIFSQSPELASVGTQEQYSQYLKSLNRPNTNPILQNNQQPDVILPIGTSGSGKSTFIKSLPQENLVVIEPDVMRVEFTGDMNDKSKDKEIYIEAAKRATKAIKQGKQVVFDTTNLTKGKRLPFIEAIKREIPNANIQYKLMELNPELAKQRIKAQLERGENRAAVSNETIDRHAESYKQMLEDIKSEPISNYDIQQEQVKKFTELQERLNNKEFLEGAKSAYENSEELKSFGTQEKYNDYIARVSLGIIKNPSSEDYNYTSQVKDIVYHRTNNIIEKFDRSKTKSNAFYFNLNPNKGEFKYLVSAILNIKKYAALPINYTSLLGDKNAAITEDDLKKQRYDGAIAFKSLDKFVKINEDATVNMTKDISQETNILESNIDKKDSDEYVVFEPEQIHILSSQADIQGFKEFVQGKQAFNKELAQKIQDKLQKLYPEIKLNITNNPVWEYNDEVFNQLFSKKTKNIALAALISYSLWNANARLINSNLQYNDDTTTNQILKKIASDGFIYTDENGNIKNIEGNSINNNAYGYLNNLWKKAGYPKITINNKVGKSRYNPLTNTISINIKRKDFSDGYIEVEKAGNDDVITGYGITADLFLAEISHALQSSQGKLYVGKFILDFIKSKGIYNNSYDIEGTLEYEAHEEIEPLLVKEFENYLYQQTLNNKIIGQANIKAMTVLIDAVNQKQDTLPHEYAHHYIAWFRNTPIVQEAIKKWGSEEALVQSIGEQVVKQEGEAYNWWNNFVKWIMNQFNSLSKLQKEELTQILTDAFLTRQDLGSQADIQGFKDFVQGKQVKEQTDNIYLHEDYLNNSNILNALFIPPTHNQLNLLKQLDNKSVKEVLEFVISNTQREDLKYVAEVYLKNVNKIHFVKFKSTPISGLKGGHYDAGKAEILFNPLIALTDTQIIERSGFEKALGVILHEFSHTFTIDALFKPKNKEEVEFKNFITEQFKYYKQITPFKDNYGFKNEREFISEILTNRDFRSDLYYRENKKEIKNNYLKNILDKILKFLGFKTNNVKEESPVEIINTILSFVNDYSKPNEYTKSGIIANNIEFQKLTAEEKARTIDRHAASYFTKNNAFFIDHVTSEAMFDNIKSYLSFHYPGIKTYDDYRNYIFELNDKDTILNFINFVTKC